MDTPMQDFLQKVKRDSAEADQRALSKGNLIKYSIVYMDDGSPSKVESAYMSSFLTMEELKFSESKRLDGNMYIIHGPEEIADQGLDDSKINRYLLEKDKNVEDMDLYRNNFVNASVQGYKYMYSAWSEIFTVERFVSCAFSKKAISKGELSEVFEKAIVEGGAIKIKKATLGTGNEINCWEKGS